MSKIQTIRNNIDNYYKQKEIERNKEKSSRRNSKWNKYYSNKYWHELRNNYYMQHPCCECCERQGIVTPTEEVHHKKRFSAGLTEQAKWNLLLSEHNLISVCKYHHNLAHVYMERYNTDTAGIDEILSIDNENKLNNI